MISTLMQSSRMQHTYPNASKRARTSAQSRIRQLYQCTILQGDGFVGKYPSHGSARHARLKVTDGKFWFWTEHESFAHQSAIGMRRSLPIIASEDFCELLIRLICFASPTLSEQSGTLSCAHVVCGQLPRGSSLATSQHMSLHVNKVFSHLRAGRRVCTSDSFHFGARVLWSVERRQSMPGNNWLSATD
jgi:hypothetical protein